MRWPSISEMAGPPPRPFPKRPRLPDDAYRNPAATFHIVIRAFPETLPFRGNVGDAVWEAIQSIEPGIWFVPVTACLMPDHLHLLARPGRADLRQGIASMKSFTTALARPMGHRRLWQPGFFDKRMRTESQLDATLEYLRRNPVEARFARTPDEWPHLTTW